METVAIMSLVLGALLIGVLIPVLVELRNVLRAARRLVDETRPALAQTLAETRAAAAGVARITSALEPAGPRVADLVDAMGGATEALRRLRTGLNVASAIAPAIKAAVAAFQSARAAKADDADSGGTATGGTATGGTQDTPDHAARYAPAVLTTAGAGANGHDVAGAVHRTPQVVVRQVYTEIDNE